MRTPSLIACLAAAGFVAATAASATAQCPGDCSADIGAQPKAVEKFVKKAWKDLAKCAKKGEPACPTACPTPDGTASPYGLTQDCVDWIECNLGDLAETAYDTTWDDLGFCASAAATECGNARGKGACKLVTTRLKRRRTSKMDKLPGDRAKCPAKVDKSGACDGATICADADAWIGDLVPLALKSGGFQTVSFDAPLAGEGRATLNFSTESADWEIAGSESVVLSYDIDGTPVGQIVLHNGHAATDYRIMLGDLTAGAHTIGLRHEKTLSPANKSGVTLEAAPTVEVFPSGDPSFEPLAFAPVLRGLDGDLNPFVSHPGNAISDVPVVTYVRSIPGAGKTTYRYVMIWSNEDGGFGNFPDVLLVQFGRTTDIETYVEVDVLTGGILDEVRYRPDESGSLSVFAGDYFQGTHPIVRTSTANGLIEDDGESRLNFFVAPYEFDDSGVPREQGMDLDPTSYVAMAKEVKRELKTEPDPNNANNPPLADLRRYLFVEYDIDVDLGGDVLAAYAVVGGTTYRSDHFTQIGGGALPTLISDGHARTAIELPFGTEITDITEWGFFGFGPVSGTLYSLEGFMLGTDFLPGATTLSFSGPLAGAGAFPTTWSVPIP